MLKKILLGVGILIALAALGAYLFANTAVELPKETDTIVAEALTAELPELVTGTTGTATNGAINIWYESKMPKDSVKGSCLLYTSPSPRDQRGSRMPSSA